MQFEKYHALGNDYLVLDPEDGALPSPAEIRLICHRHLGLGSDGILYGPLPSDNADVGLRILNPDGSEAEKSGNGLRIFARYLVDQERVPVGQDFTVETPGGRVTCHVSKTGNSIRVDMGSVSFRSSQIPVSGDDREVINEPLTLSNGTTLTVCAATIGNPHCVIPMPETNAADTHRLGPLIERHPSFPNRTNVQFLSVVNRRNIRIEIWERGAGYTMASGSSSSAAAAVAHKLGLVDDDITVHMPGGRLGIQIDPGYSIRMTGPATRVGTFQLADEALRDPNARRLVD